MSWDSPDTRFHVMVNGEEPYSIRSGRKLVPAGGRVVGVRGPNEDRLAHIERVWTELRPFSLRRALGDAA